MAVLKGLKPEKVFAYFEKLCSVPHGSGNTKIISDLCVDFAKELGLKYRQEPCNNVVIWKAASHGCESAEPIILQGHIDMVCAKTDDCTKDMTREGLDLMTDGEWVWADKTSLGGDNCIAVAMILAILSDDTLVHPPIEAVFTVDEEVGMDGAFALDCSDLKGKKLLNLDSELEGVFTVSCAGGMRSDCLLPAALTDAAGMEGFGITVAGLRGGHSGADIHLGRGSGNRLMGRVLATALEKFPGLRLAAFSGGQFDNVICSRCDAVVALPKGSGRAFEAFIREFIPIFQSFYSFISQDKEVVGLSYESHARDASLLEVLKQSRERDKIMGFSLRGIHKDELNMLLGEFPIKKEGSQGQNKTYLVALKLAQFDFLKRTGRTVPLLLLDDIFDKLDASRVEQIVKLVAGDNFGQIFITDTNRGHLDRILHKVGSDYKIFRVEEGTIQETEADNEAQ